MTHDPEITREMKRQRAALRAVRQAELAHDTLTLVSGSYDGRSSVVTVTKSELADHEEELYGLLGQVHEAFESTDRTAIYTNSRQLHVVIFKQCVKGVWDADHVGGGNFVLRRRQ